MKKLAAVLVLATLVAAVWWGARPEPSDPGSSSEDAAKPASPTGDDWTPPGAPTKAPAKAAPVDHAPIPPSSIYYWYCRSGGEGAPIETIDMAKPAELALPAMQACFEIGHRADRRQEAYSMSFVFHLNLDGSTRDLAILSDADYEAVYDATQDCVWDYWRRAPPKVPPTDEPDFICEYYWKLDTVAVPGGGQAPPKDSGIEPGTFP